MKTIGDTGQLDDCAGQWKELEESFMELDMNG